jgi:hypothetical protein
MQKEQKEQKPRKQQEPQRQQFSGMVRALMCVLLLSACSPKYDWREAGDPALGMRVLFPGKPDVAVRTILLGNLTLEMRQQGVRVDQTMFIAGGATLPADDEGMRAQAIADMRAAMVRNLGGTEVAVQTRAVPVINPAGLERGRQSGVMIEAQGRIQDAQGRMRAIFVARGNRVWQWVVLGAEVDAEQASNFLDSVRLVE